MVSSISVNIPFLCSVCGILLADIPEQMIADLGLKIDD
jgi:hypothetical protein